MSKKGNKIRELEEQKTELEYDVAFLEDRIVLLNARSAPPTLIKASPPRKKHYGGTLSFDYWPVSGWLRLSYSKWNPGKYAQLCLGPFRLDFWED